MSFGYQVLGFGSSANIASGISYGTSAVLIGTIPNATTDPNNQYILTLSPSFPTSGVVYAIRASPTADGTFEVYKSTDSSANWTRTITNQSGDGSLYGYSILAISDSIVVVQHRADLYRSTNSGSNFTHIQNLTDPNGGQNNYGRLVWDGTYGMLPSYGSNNWYTDDSFESVSSQTTTPYMQAATPLSEDGNVFLKTGFGSSGSPKIIVTTDASAASLTNIQTIDHRAIVCASDPHTSNVYFAISDKGDDDFWYATYPSTNLTAMDSGGSNNGSPHTDGVDVTNHGTMIYTKSDGGYYYNIGGTHTQFWSGDTIQCILSLDTAANAVQFVLADGKVYGIDLPIT